MSALLGLFLSLFFAFVPMFFLAAIIYWLDRYEKEPMALLGGVFSWGAIVAVIGAVVLQLILGESVLLLTGSSALENIASSSLFAPITEEALKGAAVLLIFLYFRREFDSVLDGIVYAAVAALGFAATEDFFYYFSSYTENGLGGFAMLVLLRLGVFGWQHAFFTSFTGIGLALARLNKNKLVKVGAPLFGLAIAMFTHSLHNSLLTFLSGLWGLVAAALVAWTGWLLMFGFIIYLIYREKRWMTEFLREEVDLCTITPAQYKIACSVFGQTSARLSALLGGRYRGTARFYQLCGELSHKKRQLAAFGEETGNSEEVTALRGELTALSLAVI